AQHERAGFARNRVSAHKQRRGVGSRAGIARQRAWHVCRSARRRERALRYQRQAYVARRMGAEIHRATVAERMTSAPAIRREGEDSSMSAFGGKADIAISR